MKNIIVQVQIKDVIRDVTQFLEMQGYKHVRVSKTFDGITVHYDDPQVVIKNSIVKRGFNDMRINKTYDGLRVEVRVDDVYDQYKVQQEIRKALQMEGLNAR